MPNTPRNHYSAWMEIVGSLAEGIRKDLRDPGPTVTALMPGIALKKPIEDVLAPLQSNPRKDGQP